jgi:GntR family histidine utilization transcriptional repressor
MPVPVSFRDIKSDVLARLAGGAWGPGETLPTEAELSARYGCARATVNRALRELAEEGYLERRRRSGTRVRRAPEPRARIAIPQTRDEVEGQGARYAHDLLARQERPAPAWLAARLGLVRNAPVLHLVGLHRADGDPFQHEERWINLAALPAARAADFARQAPGEWLVATMPYSEVEMGFSAVAAEADQAAALRCAEGDPLFQVERATWFDGRPVTFVRLCYRRGYRMAARI